MHSQAHYNKPHRGSHICGLSITSTWPRAQRTVVSLSEAAYCAAHPQFRCPGRPLGPASSGRHPWVSPSSISEPEGPSPGHTSPSPRASPLQGLWGSPRALLWPTRPSEIWPHQPSPELSLAPHTPLPPPHQRFSAFKTPEVGLSSQSGRPFLHLANLRLSSRLLLILLSPPLRCPPP